MIAHSLQGSCNCQATTAFKVAANFRWSTAMAQELNTLMSNGTWTHCPNPTNHNIIKNKWVYKIKHHVDGSIDRFKARLIAKGFDKKKKKGY